MDSSPWHWLWNAFKSCTVHGILCCLWIIVSLVMYSVGSHCVQGPCNTWHDLLSSLGVLFSVSVTTNDTTLKGCSLLSKSIYLGYHSAMQVAAGMGVGSLYGLLWHGTLEFVLRPSGIIDRLLDTPLARLVYLRDMRAIDNVARWEYHQWLQQRQNSKCKTK